MTRDEWWHGISADNDVIITRRAKLHSRESVQIIIIICPIDTLSADNSVQGSAPLLQLLLCWLAGPAFVVPITSSIGKTFPVLCMSLFLCANLHQKKVLQVHKSNFVVQPKTTTMTLVDFNAKEKGYNVWQRFLCIYARRRNDTITTEIRNKLLPFIAYENRLKVIQYFDRDLNSRISFVVSCGWRLRH